MTLHVPSTHMNHWFYVPLTYLYHWLTCSFCWSSSCLCSERMVVAWAWHFLSNSPTTVSRFSEFSGCQFIAASCCSIAWSCNTHTNLAQPIKYKDFLKPKYFFTFMYTMANALNIKLKNSKTLKFIIESVFNFFFVFSWGKNHEVQALWISRLYKQQNVQFILNWEISF